MSVDGVELRALEALEMRLRIAQVQARAVADYRSTLVNELLARIRDGAELIAEGKSTTADAFRLVRLQGERIDLFDATLAGSRKP